MITVLKTGAETMININHHGFWVEVRVRVNLKSVFFRARLGLLKTFLIFKIGLKLA